MTTDTAEITWTARDAAATGWREYAARTETGTRLAIRRTGSRMKDRSWGLYANGEQIARTGSLASAKDIAARRIAEGNI